MNIFINIYRNWTVYEWCFLGGSLLLIFLLSNLGTYLLTKDWKFNKIVSITYAISALIYIFTIFVLQFLPIPISHLSTTPLLLTVLIVTINWTTFISYYAKFKNRKNFTITELLKEQKRDSIRNIVFLTLAILSTSIFLKGELLTVMFVTFLSCAIPIYLSTLLTRRFIDD
jgi:hypothetical protein